MLIEKVGVYTDLLMLKHKLIVAINTECLYIHFSVKKKNLITYFHLFLV